MNLKTSAGRRRLKPYREPHWEKLPPALIKGVSLGFRRSPKNNAETWHVRVYVDRKYHTSNLGPVRPDFDEKNKGEQHHSTRGQQRSESIPTADKPKWRADLSRVRESCQGVAGQEHGGTDEYIAKHQTAIAANLRII